MKPKHRTLPPIRPNLGLEVVYRKRLQKLLEEMHCSTLYWIQARYGQHEDVIALDASPVVELRRAIRKLARRWQRRFNELAPRLAEYFAKSASQRTDAQLKRMLADAGFTVDFRLSRQQQNVLKASIAANVALIKSIPQRYMGAVEQSVMTAVQRGGKLGDLTRELVERHGVERRRAALIARDQNNKATAALQRQRQIEIGATEAIWLHSYGGRQPRKTHIANDGKRYDVVKGWYDPKEGRRIWPGELINCLPEETDIQFADNVEVAYRRRYGGVFTEIVTDSGKRLRLTPNHPVLTPDGWIAAGLLDEGDYVVEIADHVAPLFERFALAPNFEDYVNDAVPSIGQIFDALSMEWISEVALGAEFHGDATDGDVDVVFAARSLSFGLKPLLDQRSGEFGFIMPSDSYFSQGSMQPFIFGGAPLAALDIGHPGQFLALDEWSTTHPNEHGLALVAQHSSSSLYADGDRVPGEVMFIGQSEYAFPRFEFATEKHRIVIADHHVASSFGGHVYNLQTKSGWYVAGGIITHNCRCVSRTVIPGLMVVNKPDAATLQVKREAERRAR